MVFDSEATAISYAEGIDVEEGGWQFFDSSGSPLEAVFTTPNQKGLFIRSGKYHLRATNCGVFLSERLSDISAVEGPEPLNTVAAIRTHLASNNSLKSDAAKPRTLG